MKTFYFFKVSPDGELEKAVELPKFDGTIVQARAVIGSTGFPAGQYRILEDTSGVITKSVESTPKVRISFESSRKRGPRQPKPEGATEPKPKRVRR